MYMRERSRRVLAAAARIGRFLGRRKRAVMALLLVGPLLTGAGYEVFVLNAVGLGIGALIVRGQVRRRREARLHRLWLARRAECEEYEHERWLRRRERESSQSSG